MERSGNGKNGGSSGAATEKPLISVILPVYKVEKYLRQCVDSLLGQDYPNYEVILVDDGSPDGCAQICDEYAAKHAAVRVIHQKNAGVSAARNAGLRVAKGKYISFVDPDDWVDQDYLNILAQHMVPGGLAVCCSKQERTSHEYNLSRDKRETAQIQALNKEEAEQSVLCCSRKDDKSISFCVFSKIYDRDLIAVHEISFCEDLIYYEDELFLIQYLSHIKGNVIWSKAAPYHYRIHSQSASRQYIKRHSRFDRRLFSEIAVHEQELRYVEQTPEILRLLSARQIRAKRNALHIMAASDWDNLEYFKRYLRDLRSGILPYLLCKTGESVTSRLYTLICAIHPRLALWAYGLWTDIKKCGGIQTEWIP